MNRVNKYISFSFSFVFVAARHDWKYSVQTRSSFFAPLFDHTLIFISRQNDSKRELHTFNTHTNVGKFTSFFIDQRRPEFQRYNRLRSRDLLAHVPPFIVIIIYVKNIIIQTVLSDQINVDKPSCNNNNTRSERNRTLNDLQTVGMVGTNVLAADGNFGNIAMRKFRLLVLPLIVCWFSDQIVRCGSVADDDFVDPLDLINYDRATKSMKPRHKPNGEPVHNDRCTAFLSRFVNLLLHNTGLSRVIK